MKRGVPGRNDPGVVGNALIRLFAQNSQAPKSSNFGGLPVYFVERPTPPKAANEPVPPYTTAA